MKTHIYDFDLAQWQEYLRTKGYPAYRARQIFEWLHRHMVSSPQECHNLPTELRQLLEEEFHWPGGEEIRSLQSSDGTVKFLIAFSQRKVIETVWLPYPNRQSLCVSVQAGCSLNCRFCATGKIPFGGNLTTGEILTQFYLTQRTMQKKVTNVVFMGMGEPFYNYEATIKAAFLMHSTLGQSVGARHITISTAGVLPAVERFYQEKNPFGLALSVHAVFPEKRREIMDIEKKYPLQDLLKVLRQYRDRIRKNRFTFEYIMIRKFNMYREDAQKLAELAREFRAKINLIPLHTRFYGMEPPSEEEQNLFFKWLYEEGVLARNRRSPGKDIEAACGMLAAGKLQTNLLASLIQ
ncbi:MAG: 23S rRNA (adenine(2503)-C(2))-methyltransferase RlmN [Leptospiraceae bacterium]|nr:23S rRNA (adenine(2503)-C(2))-methyltransferase RlmN [Leptospiraceae bacterium]MDW8307075.1 23S rRNA (adenine(2503)-C(2))-methyltransferase RlmN [Leptospiraceae bacterium]